MDFISPTMGVVKTGQVIVSNGEIVTAEIEQLLDSYKAEYDANVGYNGSEALLWLGNILIAFFMVLVLFLAWLYTRRRTRLFNDYIESVAYEADNAKNSTIMCFPLPIAVFRLDDSRIVWGNEMFFQMCGEPGQRLDATLGELVPHFNGTWLIEGKKRYPTLLEMGGRKYQLHGNVIPSENGHNNVLMGITYWAFS